MRCEAILLFGLTLSLPANLVLNDESTQVGFDAVKDQELKSSSLLRNGNPDTMKEETNKAEVGGNKTVEAAKSDETKSTNTKVAEREKEEIKSTQNTYKKEADSPDTKKSSIDISNFIPLKEVIKDLAAILPQDSKPYIAPKTATVNYVALKDVIDNISKVASSGKSTEDKETKATQAKSADTIPEDKVVVTKPSQSESDQKLENLKKKDVKDKKLDSFVPLGTVLKTFIPTLAQEKVKDSSENPDLKSSFTSTKVDFVNYKDVLKAVDNANNKLSEKDDKKEDKKPEIDGSMKESDTKDPKKLVKFEAKKPNAVEGFLRNVLGALFGY